jgi:RecB family exonuclease
MGNTPYILSQSEYRTYKSCKRSWYLSYYRKLGLAPDRESVVGARNLGLAVHLALEGYYGHGLDPLAVLDTHYTDLINQNGAGYVSELLAERSYAMTMVRGFLQWAEVEGVDAEFEVVGTESDASALIDTAHGNILLRGRLDQVVRRRGGDEALLLRDFKTVSAFIDPEVLQRDEQMRFYALLQWLNAEDSGDRVDGALYTMLLKSKRTVRATPPFYATMQVRYNVNDYKSMLLRVKRVALEILQTTEALNEGLDHRDVAYPNPGDKCKWCVFAPVCTMADDGSRFDDALAANYVTVNPMGHYENSRINKVKELLGD